MCLPGDRLAQEQGSREGPPGMLDPIACVPKGGLGWGAWNDMDPRAHGRSRLFPSVWILVVYTVESVHNSVKLFLRGCFLLSTAITQRS